MPVEQRGSVPVISEVELRKALRMDDVIAAVEGGFRELASKNVIMPQRSALEISDNQALLTMPAYVGGANKALGTKLVTVFQKNPEHHGLPTIQATIVCFDAETGRPRAILDGTSITAYRTGAASAVATKYLARKNAKELGLIGSGVQARTQLLGVCSVRGVERVKVYSRDPKHVRSFISEMNGVVHANLEAARTAKDALKGSDIVVTSTSSAKPVLDYEWLDEGTHINAIGSFRSNMRELDEETVMKAKLVVDSREACLAEAGDIIIPIKDGKLTPDHIYTELGEIVAGEKQGRTDEKELTVFKSVGLAFEDIVTARMVLEKLKTA